MQWYSYSRTADFDKLRSIAHRCAVDCGGFEYEYCFAEYEYRFAEYDTNRRNQTLAVVNSFIVLDVVRKTQTARVLPPHPPTPSPPPGGEGEIRLNTVHPYFPCLTARSDGGYELIFKGDTRYMLGTPSPAWAGARGGGDEGGKSTGLRSKLPAAGQSSSRLGR